ncbi:uncharacterized protein DNG_07669 [Cephalotrichum gorgonifer]|uniref:Uncharacterized protein n=1 Tax=Cephalotrichum gorgonifer TaxID=2041049 RepID=A0AAE8N3R1_9PEZI|nr:uncharacterized protein DNG_07669 [Cephalotrichum gorgonifer]
MLSHRPPTGLFTYNFELDRLLVTTYDPATSSALDEQEHATKLILTLRQFRDAPRGRAKKVEIGYLFILHSGTSAIERLDLRKIRQATSPGASPAYKIRGEGRRIVFQYLCGDGNARKIDIEFRKQLEYERALQILLSQGLSVVIKRPEHAPMRHQPFGPAAPGSLHAVLPTQATVIRQNSVSGTPRAWNAPFERPSRLQSPVDRPSRTTMPPPGARDARDARSPSLLGGVAGNYYHTGLYSPANDNYGLCTPAQSQRSVTKLSPANVGRLPGEQILS